MTGEPVRVRCGNTNGGPEGFRLRPRERDVPIDTPGALTRTVWTVEQLRKLRRAIDDALGELGGKQ